MNRRGHNDDNNNDFAANNRLLRIQDLDTWLRTHGIEAADDARRRPPDLNRQEEEVKFQELSGYQEAVHKAIFLASEKEEEKAEEEKRKIMQSWKMIRIHLFCADRQALRDVPLQPLAESCDAVFALATQWERFSSSSSLSLSSSSSPVSQVDNDDDDNTKQEENSNCMHLSLESFPIASVKAFLHLVLLDSKSNNTNNDENENKESVESDSKQQQQEASRDYLTEDTVVDCCQIAHYLQNDTILNQSVEILLQSVDKGNCASLCQLADQLSLPTLFEKSLSKMMDTLQDLESTDAWKELTPELQERVMNIQSAIQSSVHSVDSRLYFSSLDEYIAIFAERVQYYKERLAEANEDQQREIPGTKNWKYAQAKIERQEKRVRTLELAFQQQKKVFRGSRRPL